MTFKEFLATAPITDDPEGDFIGDSRRVRDFPAADNWPEIERYLSRRGSRDAVDDVIEAGKNVWDAYRHHLTS